MHLPRSVSAPPAAYTTHPIFCRDSQETSVAVAIVVVSIIIVGIGMCCFTLCRKECNSVCCSNCLSAWEKNCCCCPKIRGGYGGTATIYMVDGVNVGVRGSTEVTELSERPGMVALPAEPAGEGRRGEIRSMGGDDEEELPTYRPRSAGSMREVDAITPPPPLNDTNCVEDPDIAEPPPAYASTFPRTQYYHMHTVQPVQRARHLNLEGDCIDQCTMMSQEPILIVFEVRILSSLAPKCIFAAPRCFSHCIMRAHLWTRNTSKLSALHIQS